MKIILWNASQKVLIGIGYVKRLQICVLLTTLLVAGYAAGQSIVTGDVVGTVVDPAGAVVSGARITLTS